MQMAADAEGADQHQRADAVQNGAFQLRVGQADALFGGLAGDLVQRRLGLGFAALRPFAGQRGG
jgi:hypothetical protein